MSTREILRCRWCSYSTPKFYVGQDGKTRSGWGRLLAHQDSEHPDEREALQAEAAASGADAELRERSL